MIVYAALGSGARTVRAALEEMRYPALLHSYAANSSAGWEYLAYTVPYRFADSGAFSAWTRGAVIDLDDYCAWCRKVEPTLVASLDVIPGTPFAPPTKKEVKRGMTASLENGDYLREQGFAIVETYHQFEPLSHLATLLDRRRPGEVLALSPSDAESERSRGAFLSDCFAYLRDNFGWQKLPPCHGFGVTGFRQTGRFPWYSVDSSSWNAVSRWARSASRDGKIGDPDWRTSSVRDVNWVAMTRVLRRWQREAATITELWERRGIRFADEEVAA